MASHYEQAQKLQNQAQEREKQDEDIVRELENLDKNIIVADGKVRGAQEELGHWEAMAVQIAELQGAKARVTQEHEALQASMVSKGMDLYSESLDQLEAQMNDFNNVLMQNTEKLQQEQKALRDQEQK